MQDQANQRLGLKDIFLAARGKTDAEERKRYLSEIFGDDDVMRHRVEQMLLALKSSVPRPLDAVIATIERPWQIEIEGNKSDIEGPRQIGPYKIREKIAEGGMGAVYIAEQTEPVRRKVALKVIKPGMSGPQVVARFEAERQALAMMDHPNIARVLDGGATEDELPYFVMELVHGLPITEYCDNKRLTPRQRLELFVGVCLAVQHAHQKGIIHRDLKPSNIMVAEIDGKAVPKVIDFGVAKALNQKLSGESVHTQYSQILGTPLYMSPEQADLGVVDVDTRSDVYSLGVVLYELLTGETPFDREQLKKVTFDEMRRIIREEEPRRPSVLVSTIVAEAQSTVADHRSVDSQKLRQILTGELDWLVMKALEKDRERRYKSATALSDDIECFLQDQPIAARPQSATYRVSKFAKRNRGRLVVASAVASVLLVGIFVAISTKLDRDRVRRQQTERIHSLVGAARAAINSAELPTAEQRLAEARSSIANARVAESYLAPTLKQLDKEIKVRRAQQQAYENFSTLAQVCLQYEEGTQRLEDVQRLKNALAVYSVLTDDNWLQKLQDSYLPAALQASVQEEVYNLLLLLAEEVRDKDSGTSLEYLRRASNFHEPTRAFYWVRRDCLNRLGQKQNAERDTELIKQSPAVFAMDHFLPAQAAASRGDNGEAIRGYEAALLVQPNHYRSLFNLAFSLSEVGRDAEAAQAWRGCIALRPGFPAPYGNLAIALKSLGDRDQAMKVAELAVKRHRRYDNAWRIRGELNVEKEKYDEALADYSRAIKLKKNSASLVVARGNVFRKQGKEDRAIVDFERAIELDPEYAEAYFWRAKVYNAKRRFDAAITDFSKVIELGPLNSGDFYSSAYSHRGVCLLSLGKKQEGLEDCNRAIELDPDYAGGFHNRGIIYSALGQFDKAAADYTKALELYESDDLHYIGNLFFARSISYGMQERFEEAIRDLEKAIELQPNRPDHQAALGWARGFTSDNAGAIENFERAIALAPNESFLYTEQVEFRVYCGGIEDSSAPETLLLAQKAVDLAPKSSTAWAVLGLAQCKCGDHTAAIASVSKAFDLATDDPLYVSNEVGALLVLAQSYHRLGDRDEGMRHFQQANARIIEKDLAENFLARRTVLVFRDEVAEELHREKKSIVPRQEAED